MLMHAANNAVAGSFFAPMFSGADSVRQAWLLALVWWVVAVLVIVISGPTNLSRKYQKQEEPLPESDPGTVSQFVLRNKKALAEPNRPRNSRSVIMSSMVKWGAIAGVAAAALLIL